MAPVRSRVVTVIAWSSVNKPSSPDQSVPSLGWVYDPVGLQWRRVTGDPTGAINVVDSGLHTNPRKYEKDHGFVSTLIILVAPATSPIWAVGTAGLNPLIGRTAGKKTTIYSIQYYNGGTTTCLATLVVAGNPIGIVGLASGQIAVLDYPAGANIGDNDVGFNTDSAAGPVFGQVFGTEE